MSDDILTNEDSDQRQLVSNAVSPLEEQKYIHRKWMFRIVVGVCFASYMAFLYLFWKIMFDSATSLLESKHFLVLMMSLFIVPSLMIGRMIKAVFAEKHEDTQTPLQELARAIRESV